MTYSIRIGFLLAIFSVFLWAGVYQGKHLSHEKTRQFQTKSSSIIFIQPAPINFSRAFFDRIKFEDYRLVLRDFAFKKVTPNSTSSSDVSNSTKASLNLNKTPAANTIPKNITLGSETPTAVDPSTLTSVQSAALLGDMGHTQLLIRLSQRPLYSVHVNDALTVITLTLDNINPDLSALPPLDTQATAIQNIVFSDSATNQLVITITLQPQVGVQSLRYKDNNLVLDVGSEPQIPYVQKNQKTTAQTDLQTVSQANSQADSPADIDTVPIVKKAVPPTPEAVAAENYNEALDLVNQGNIQGAKELLQMVVTQHASYIPARILLANLFVQQGDPQQALIILQGIQPQPNIQDDPGYYNLLAEIYRQLNQPKIAVNIYQQLLSMDANNGSWWVGLGMCFEALDQLAAAKEAYQKAQATRNLPPVLLDFIAKKLEESQ